MLLLVIVKSKARYGIPLVASLCPLKLLICDQGSATPNMGMHSVKVAASVLILQRGGAVWLRIVVVSSEYPSHRTVIAGRIRASNRAVGLSAMYGIDMVSSAS